MRRARRAVMAAAVGLLMTGLAAAVDAPAAEPATEHVATGSASTAWSTDFGSGLSGDGRFIAFHSPASGLVPGDTNDLTDVFVRDRQTGTTERVNVSTRGAQATQGGSEPSISADGRFVAFSSDAPNLVPGDTNGVSDVFVRDRQGGATERVSVGPGGAQRETGSTGASISADGRFVAFRSDVPLHSAGAVLVHDRQAGTTKRIAAGEQPDISADGRFVAFVSDDSGLVPGDTNGSPDIFVHDRQTGENDRVSVDTAGDDLIYPSRPSISADGRYVAFETEWGPALASGAYVEGSGVYVRDRLAHTTTTVSVRTGSPRGFGSSSRADISGDGRYVVFESSADHLVAGDTNRTTDVFIRDLTTGGMERVSVAGDGAQGADDSHEPAISADGHHVTFATASPNLIPDDGDGDWDLFLRGPLSDVGEPPPMGPDWVGPFMYGGCSDTYMSCRGHLAVAADGTVLGAGDDELGDHTQAYAVLRRPGSAWDHVDLTGLFGRRLGVEGIDRVRAAGLSDVGEASVVTGREDAGGLFEAFRFPTGAWQARELPLPDDTVLATGADGTTVAAWRVATTPTIATVRAAVRHGLAGGWVDHQDLSYPAGPALTSRSVDDLAVIVDDVGILSVAYIHGRPEGDGLWVARHTPKDGWATPELITAGKDGSQYRIASLATAPDGRLALAWWEESGGPTVTLNVSIRDPGGGAWKSRPVVTLPASQGDGAGLDVGDDGRATVAWGDEIAPSGPASPRPMWRVRVAEGDAAEPWSITTIATQSFAAEELQAVGDLSVAVDRLGGASIAWVWHHNLAESSWHQMVARPPGGHWSIPLEVDAGSAGPVSASDAQGDHVISLRAGVILAWDATGPRLTPTFPAGVAAGTAATFSVESLDTWSGLAGPPRWDFGDGRGATGSSVSHVYDTPGTYTASVTQDDGIGNRSMRTATMQVGAQEAPLAPGSSQAVQVPAPAMGSPVCRPAPVRHTSVKSAVRLSEEALAIQQRIDSAALRRLNAANAWINQGIVPGDLCAGAFGPRAFQAGIPWIGGGSAQRADPPTPRPLRIVDRRKAAADFTLDMRQIRINDTISRALHARAEATWERIQTLTGGNLAPGARLRGRPLYAGLAIGGPLPAGAQVGPTPLSVGPLPPAGRLEVSAAQLRRTQRRSQDAIVIANRVNDRIAQGLTEAQFRPGSIGADALG